MEPHAKKLTKRIIDRFSPAARRFVVLYTEHGGFVVRIGPTGRKTFVVRYRAEGGGRTAPQRLMSIGRYGVLTPDEARKAAKNVLGAVTKGDDPAGALTEARLRNSATCISM